jgi:predicted secreted protein
MAKYAAFGTILRIGSTSGSGGTAVANVTSIDGPELSLETIDVTTHDSTGGWRQFIGGLLDAGEVPLELVFDPALGTHRNASGGLLHALINRTTTEFTLVLPSSPTVSWYFNALVTAFQVQAPIDDKLPANVTLKITGNPTIPS